MRLTAELITLAVPIIALIAVCVWAIWQERK